MLTERRRGRRDGSLPVAIISLVAVLGVSGCGILEPGTVWVEDEQASSVYDDSAAEPRTLAEFVENQPITAARFAERLSDSIKGLRSGAPVSDALPTGSALVPLFSWRSGPSSATECTGFRSALETGSVDVRPNERAAGFTVIELANRGPLHVVVLAGDVLHDEFDQVTALHDAVVDPGASGEIVVCVAFAHGSAYPTASGTDSLEVHERPERKRASDEGYVASLNAAFSNSTRVVGVAAWSPRGLRFVELFSSAWTFRGVTDRVLDRARERLDGLTKETPGNAAPENGIAVDGVAVDEAAPRNAVGAGPWRRYSVDAIDVVLEALGLPDPSSSGKPARSRARSIMGTKKSPSRSVII